MKNKTKEEIFELHQNRIIGISKAMDLAKYENIEEFWADYYESGYKTPVPSQEEKELQMVIFDKFYKKANPNKNFLSSLRTTVKQMWQKIKN